MATMNLFEPFAQRSLSLRNRLVVSPMCQYSATDGLPDNWHLVHLGSRAVGGAAAVIAEATAVSAQGRISLGDTGLWNETQLEAWRPIALSSSRMARLPACNWRTPDASPARSDLGKGAAHYLSDSRIG
jgi:2,4-dienoyl-CoA reductase-like NADH-dependent reductase (Old Yellow Enzyme family)